MFPKTILASAPLSGEPRDWQERYRKRRKEGDGLARLRQWDVSYVKWERSWPSRVNRLWAVSHSWQTHNYSISSTINGNTLKLNKEIKQTPCPACPTHPPPLIHPSPSLSLHLRVLTLCHPCPTLHSIIFLSSHLCVLHTFTFTAPH